MFDRYIGIDYSGAKTSTDRLAGLAVYRASGNALPERVLTYAHNATRWTRLELAHWLVKQLQKSTRTLVGIDHAFSFPLNYFQHFPQIPQDNWCAFLDDFQHHWPTDGDGVTVRAQYYEQVRCMMGIHPGEHRFGIGDWFRLTDPTNAASVFDFMAGARSVAFSTHAGLPWLRCIRQQLREAGAQVHFWPFDGWCIPESGSVVVEVYPALWKACFSRGDMNNHQHDAYSVARWMSETDQQDLLEQYFHPNLDAPQCDRAGTEGWILGVMDPVVRGQ